MNNLAKLKAKWEKGLYLSIGLDTEPEKVPASLSVLLFNKKVVDATKDIVLGYKLNSAFYEKHGAEGMDAMRKTVAYIKETSPDSFLIVDAKRGDIGSTNTGYTYFLTNIGFDAMTIHSYLGQEANETFLNHKDKFFFVLAKTSNPGSGEFQDLETEGVPLYLKVAGNVMQKWNTNNNCGLVVGGTFPEHLLRVRHEAGEEAVFLIPGIGAQGGDLKSTIQCGLNAKNEGVVINMSRSIIYASSGEDFAEVARKEAEKFNNEVKEYLKLSKRLWKDEKREFYKQRTLEIFEKTGAVFTNDHFVYQTKSHGSAYVTKDKWLSDPLAINEICMMIADLIKDEDVDTVAVPAVGGIVLGHVVAKYLSYFKGRTINSVFVEKSGKDEEGRDLFKITRGYEEYLKGKKVAMVEDTVNTGYSIQRVMNVVKDVGGEIKILAIACDREAHAEGFAKDLKLVSLTKLPFEKYEPQDCPLCKKGIPINTKYGKGEAYLKEKK